MIKRVLLSLTLIVSLTSGAQTSNFTLKECVEYAWMNNLDVRQTILNYETSKIDARQSRTQMLPTLSAGAGQNYQFGRTIDRFTNTFVNQTIRTNNVSLNANFVLYNGLQFENAIRNQDALLKANNENIQTIKNQIALSISSAFLQTIQADENIKNAEFQITTTSNRIERAQKMVDAGTTDLSALLSLKAQLANEQLNLITAQNTKVSAILNLKTLMQMPFENELNIEIPKIPGELMINTLNAMQIYTIALGNMPQVKAAEYQAESAGIQSKISRGNMAPSISMYGNISTVYSQNSKAITSVTQTGTQVIGVTQTNNEAVIQPTFAYTTKTIDFGKQMKDNLGQSMGLSLNWNLFGGFQVQNQYQKSKINMQISEMNLTKVKNTLLSDINIAVTNYNAARARYDAARNNVEAQKLSLDYVQKRYDAGASTSFDFIQSKNNFLQSQTTETQARYELIFRGLILEFYKGNPITL